MENTFGKQLCIKFSIYTIIFKEETFANIFIKGRSMTTYLDKKRWVGGQKCLFLSTIRVKNVHLDVGRW